MATPATDNSAGGRPSGPVLCGLHGQGGRTEARQGEQRIDAVALRLEDALRGHPFRAPNPNVLTLDKGTSRLGQGPVAHSALVEVEPWTGALPEVTAFEPPPFVERARDVSHSREKENGQ